MLQPMLRPEGDRGYYYSKRALSKMFNVPYHLLRPAAINADGFSRSAQQVLRRNLRRFDSTAQTMFARILWILLSDS